MGRLLKPTPLSLDFGLLVLRATGGLSLALGAGWGKVKDIAPFEQAIAQLGFKPPAAWAWAAALSEFIGGLLVAAGLLTRVGAFFAAVVMGVALGKVLAGEPFEKQMPALLLLGMFVTVFLCGPGKLSLDQAFFGKARSSAPKPK
ncbi:MAG TPA: DoxX family protein [Planctomycetota bacterium]|nr:DoxX family protein [Planctomycetota bacterium]